MLEKEPNPTSPLNALLLVNDEPNDLFLWRRAIHRAHPDTKMIEVTSAADALEFLASNRVSAVVTDNRMPLMDGVEMVRRIRLTDTVTPIFMLTGLDSAEPDALAAGVTDFVKLATLQDAATQMAQQVLSKLGLLSRESQRAEAVPPPRAPACAA